MPRKSHLLKNAFWLYLIYFSLYLLLLSTSFSYSPERLFKNITALYSTVIFYLILFICQVYFLDFSQLLFHYFSHHTIRIPLRISNFSTFNPAFFQHFVNTDMISFVSSCRLCKFIDRQFLIFFICHAFLLSFHRVHHSYFFILLI